MLRVHFLHMLNHFSPPVWINYLFDRTTIRTALSIGKSATNLISRRFSLPDLQFRPCVLFMSPKSFTIDYISGRNLQFMLCLLCTCPMALQHLGFRQFSDDLFWCVSFSFWHFLPPFPLIISFYLDQFLGVRSISCKQTDYLWCSLTLVWSRIRKKLETQHCYMCLIYRNYFPPSIY